MKIRQEIVELSQINNDAKTSKPPPSYPKKRYETPSEDRLTRSLQTLKKEHSFYRKDHKNDGIKLGKSPKQRLVEVMSAFSDSINTRRDYIYLWGNRNKKEWSTFTKKNPTSNDFKGPFKDQLKELKHHNELAEELFTRSVEPEKLDEKSSLLKAMGGYLVVKKNIRKHFDEDAPERSKKGINEFYENTLPSFAVLPSGNLLQHQAINNWVHFSLKELVFFESMRQQIFTGKGLNCPGNNVGPYFTPPCKLQSDGDLDDCGFRPFLASIWRNTKPDSEEQKWTKPECL